MYETKLKTDYLIVGSGAVGMAFADTMLTDSDADLIIIDRHHKPGGHWNVAYPFVTLHQPAAFYGVCSKELSNGKLDEVGLNKGLGHLASGAEVSAYFDDVMRHRFLPSGRVRYYPMCDYLGDNKFQSLLTGEVFEVEVARRRVDLNDFTELHEETFFGPMACKAAHTCPAMESQSVFDTIAPSRIEDDLLMVSVASRKGFAVHIGQCLRVAEITGFAQGEVEGNRLIRIPILGH